MVSYSRLHIHLPDQSGSPKTRPPFPRHGNALCRAYNGKFLNASNKDMIVLATRLASARNNDGFVVSPAELDVNRRFCPRCRRCQTDHIDVEETYSAS